MVEKKTVRNNCIESEVSFHKKFNKRNQHTNIKNIFEDVFITRWFLLKSHSEEEREGGKINKRMLSGTIVFTIDRLHAVRRKKKIIQKSHPHVKHYIAIV